MKKSERSNVPHKKKTEVENKAQLTRRAFVVESASLIASAATLGLWPRALGHAAGTEVSPQSPGATIPLPAGKATQGTFRFVVVGDTGTGDEAQFSIARRMTIYQDERPYDTVLMVGDNIYPTGNPAELPSKFEQPYAELLKRRVRFYAALGIHDVAEGRKAQMNYKQFNMGGRAYYSFTKGDGMIEFFALDSTLMDAAQLVWLGGGLAASKARWKIAYFHHPLYSSAKTHGSDTKLRALVEPLFLNYNVAVVFSGHDHVYERTKLQKGVQYFVTGAGGKLRRGDLNRGNSFFAAGNDQVNNFMYIEVTKERIAFWAVDDAGNVLDSGTLGTSREPDNPK